MCLRIINRIRFRLGMLSVARWLFNDEGGFSDQFKADLCGINCAGTTPSTASTTTVETSSTSTTTTEGTTTTTTTTTEPTTTTTTTEPTTTTTTSSTTTTTTLSTTSTTTESCAVPGVPELSISGDCSITLDGGIGLAWIPDGPPADYYSVYRSENGGAYVFLTTVATADHFDAGVIIGNEYCYKVNACNVCGCSAFSNIVCCTPD